MSLYWVRKRIISTSAGVSAGFFMVCLLCSLLCAPFDPAYAVEETADEWSAAGIFISATPPSAAITGIGSNTLSWGIPLLGSFSSSASYSPNVFSGSNIPFPTAGTIGTLTFRNGTIQAGTEITGGTLQLNLGGCFHTSFGCIVGPIESDIGRIDFITINTVNTSDPIKSSDGFFIPKIDMAAWVEEGGTAVFGLNFVRHSPLEITDIFLISGPGFVSIGDQPVPLVTPEPTTLLLFGSTMIGLGLAARRRRHWQN